MNGGREDLELHVLVQGYPGKAVCHGGLGWSTIALLRMIDRVILIDSGGFGIRRTLIERLKGLGLEPADVTDVILTHAHYDHAVNWVLFPNAVVSIGRRELEWAVQVPLGYTPVAEFYARELMKSPQLRLVEDEEEVLPGLKAMAAPGHTPGHLIFVLSKDSGDLIFTGDAAKNRAELLSMTADATMDAAKSRETMANIWVIWRRRPENLLIPGHDMPMVLKDGLPEYVGRREAAIAAWRGDDLDQIITYDLTLV